MNVFHCVRTGNNVHSCTCACEQSQSRVLLVKWKTDNTLSCVCYSTLLVKKTQFSTTKKDQEGILKLNIINVVFCRHRIDPVGLLVEGRIIPEKPAPQTVSVSRTVCWIFALQVMYYNMVKPCKYRQWGGHSSKVSILTRCPYFVFVSSWDENKCF